MRMPITVAVFSTLIGLGVAQAAERVEFNRDVRPILSENCFQCHGPDKNKRKAKLRLDERESAITKKAIVPGKPDMSELVTRIFSAETNEVMPPPESHKKLTPAQKETLKRWIAEGAEYQPHWAYIVPQRPTLPMVKNSAWVRNPVDTFILANLETKSVKPSPEADRRTLIRRAYLDLTGLPPNPNDVGTFVRDEETGAFRRVVDKLLDSPHFGERMAVAWLDLVRFSDTVGYHGDQNQNIFPYRDYVIDSFNKNKPFDQFTIEQLAGDLLPNPTPEQLVATGFNRLNMMTREGGAQPNEYLAKYAADRVRTVSITWLGSTMGCAECHDHKFDPFTQRDFYSLAAFFSDVKQWGVYHDYGYTPNPDLKGFSNDHPFPPEIEVTSPFLLQRQVRLRDAMRQVASGVKLEGKTKTAYDDWLKAAREFVAKSADGWATPPATLTETPAGAVESTPKPAAKKPKKPAADAKSATVDKEKAKPAVVAAAQADGSLLLSGKAVSGGVQTFALKPAVGWIASLRLELLPHSAHQDKVTRDAADTTTIRLAATVKPASGGKDQPLGFFFAEADARQYRYANGSPVLGIHGRDGWLTVPQRKSERQTAVWLLDRPVRIAADDQLLVTVLSDNVGCVRLSVSPFAGEDPLQLNATDLSKALTTPGEKRNAEQEAILRTAYLRGTAFDAAAVAKVRSLQREYFDCRGGKAFSMVTQAWEPKATRVLPRGNWQDESGPVVQPSVPSFLLQSASNNGRRLTRLDLARWLTAADNPLTARVFVNRLWKQFFGTGLSGVMEDVGAQGEPPSHPALLDWLAVEFRESGWNVKHLVRLMVMSSTYRQDSRTRPELRDRDPSNRWVAFMSPRRLEAEFVRDNALAVAGLLNEDMGGPSIKPYQPPGYYANIQFPDRTYIPNTDERQYRRGIYMHWQRTFLHPMLANFDAPSREECTACRTVANTPQQALTLLNDPSFVEAARVMAERLLTKATTESQRINQLFDLTLARSPRPAETKSLLNFLATQRDYYRGNPAEAKKLLRIGNDPTEESVQPFELAAWTSLCRVVLNLHETITRY